MSPFLLIFFMIIWMRFLDLGIRGVLQRLGLLKGPTSFVSQVNLISNFVWWDYERRRQSTRARAGRTGFGHHSAARLLLHVMSCHVVWHSTRDAASLHSLPSNLCTFLYLYYSGGGSGHPPAISCRGSVLCSAQVGGAWWSLSAWFTQAGAAGWLGIYIGWCVLLWFGGLEGAIEWGRCRHPDWSWRRMFLARTAGLTTFRISWM